MGRSSASSAPSIITNLILSSRVIVVSHWISTLTLGVMPTSAHLWGTDYR